MIPDAWPEKASSALEYLGTDNTVIPAALAAGTRTPARASHKKGGRRVVADPAAAGEERFAPRYFHALWNALSSPRGALTAVFGMGTGVTPPQEARTKGEADPTDCLGRPMHARAARRGPVYVFRLSSPALRGRPHGGPARGAGGVQASRPIRSGRVNASRRLRPRPVKRVFFPRPSGACARDG